MEDQNNNKITSKYATKKVDSRFFGIVNVEARELVGDESSDKGYIWVPYIMDSSVGPSEEYDQFRKEYRLNHEVCPKCGSKSYMTTLMGYILDMNNKEDYKDLNRCTCQGCDDVHTAHDRISKEEFNNKKQ